MLSDVFFKGLMKDIAPTFSMKITNQWKNSQLIERQLNLFIYDNEDKMIFKKITTK